MFADLQVESSSIESFFLLFLGDPSVNDDGLVALEAGWDWVRRRLGKIGVQLWKWIPCGGVCDSGCIGVALCVETVE